MRDDLKAIGVNVAMMTRHASLDDARTAARSSQSQIRLVVMGDDGRYWVVSARDAGILRNAGYETI